ncbi:RNA polymerase subunit sigma-70 [Clostridium tetani]|uniref:sigma-70 family RNA polymerase sigma factor n=1 Tax=Clostridium tetani TaxID=1513 RepID=UPI00100A9803|nr:sigma-70 family RNA polymerase sigma factor [Clostridium tetani]RXI51865.1 RNA polymerase subunit sigma-70 [Clostridium tetani]RXI56327.1 RNA polymerase subunit sigma-70 [Clostridium tetani]RXM70780.1 RNA polymerase subunit sigma-70 [Clostridium tetani]
MYDVLLVKRAIRGTKDAFTSLIKQCKNELYKIAYIYTKNEDDALEAIDESIYKAYISINTLKNPEFFKTWIIRILINECITLLKKKNKIVLENNNTKFEIQCNDDYDSKIEFEDLYKAINTLNDKQRTAIILKYFQDLKISEISDVMQISDNTVKSHIRRGILSLKKSLKEDLYYGQ